MRRSVAAITTVAFILGLMAFIVASALDQRLPPMASEQVGQYLRARNAAAGQALSVVRFFRAARPDRFDAGLSSASIVDSYYYRTTRGFAVAATPSASAAGTPSIGGGGAAWGARALPYPPRDVWCLLLAYEPGAPSPPEVAFVAMHQDLYNAQWVFHEAAGGADNPAIRQRLDAIGCRLD